jgi:hypothetical protein
MGWTAEELRFNSQCGQEIFPFSTASNPAPEPNQSPIPLGPGGVSSGVKQPGSEADTHLHLRPKLRMSGTTTPVFSVQLSTMQ